MSNFFKSKRRNTPINFNFKNRMSLGSLNEYQENKNDMTIIDDQITSTDFPPPPPLQKSKSIRSTEPILATTKRVRFEEPGNAQDGQVGKIEKPDELIGLEKIVQAELLTSISGAPTPPSTPRVTYSRQDAFKNDNIVEVSGSRPRTSALGSQEEFLILSAPLKKQEKSIKRISILNRLSLRGMMGRMSPEQDVSVECFFVF